MNLKKNIFNAITIILLAALIAGAVLLNNRIKKLETQMSYTSDNTSVILSDVQTMQDDIKSTLEEEADDFCDALVHTHRCNDSLVVTYGAKQIS